MVDSHCHIAGPEFVDDLDAVIARARDAGLVHALVVLAADDDSELQQAAAVSARWGGVRFAIADIPLLYEIGRDRDVDVVVVTAVPPDVQARRIVQRWMARESG